MEWEEFWRNLLTDKRLVAKVQEMDYVDHLRGQNRLTEKICRQIYDDYGSWRKELHAIRKRVLEKVDTIEGIHLQSSRIKSLNSLIMKVVNKRHENIVSRTSSYAHIDGENYKRIITDLIGIRLIISYRGKWLDVHNSILTLFPLEDPTSYQAPALLPHDDGSSAFLAEPPKAYYAPGDQYRQYEEHGLIPRQHSMGYRSIHYTVSYESAYIEIQVRTIYDEAWSECDHSYVYKHETNASSRALAQLSAMLCELTNTASDIGENMRTIFAGGCLLDSNSQRWNVTGDCARSFDDALSRLENVTERLRAFRSQMEVAGESPPEAPVNSPALRR